MSDVLKWADTLEELSENQREAPPKRWRNRWRLPCSMWVRDGGVERHVGPGDEWGLEVFPSFELAENRAQIALAKWEYLKSLMQVDAPEYLGAFPVDDQ